MNTQLKTEDIQPVVRIANHHLVAANTTWKRSIPDAQILCILEGEFAYQEMEQPAVCLAQGDVLFIEPEIRHRLSLLPTCSEGRLSGMHLEFTPTGRWAADDYRLALKPARVTHLADPAYLQGRFQRLAAVHEGYQPFREALVSAIAREIILLLAAYWEGENGRTPRPSLRMETILHYIRQNLTQPLTRQSLAASFNLSAGYVNQLFKVELGMTPTAVINRERGARAYQLIDREGLTVAEAALAVGFQDPFYFSRVFKQIYGIPPSQVGSRR